MPTDTSLQLGLTLSSEEHPPRRLVEVARLAEEHGFDFVSISDHYHPWISEQGHSPFVWGVLGAIAEATEQLDVGVGVTCPTIRIHPAILAQAVATASLLLEGRLTWGIGSGENLNEHILGHRWPPADVRQDMMVEAVEVIRRLWREDSVTHRGTYYTVEDARILDKPGQVPIIVSAFGDRAVDIAAEIGDGLWVTGPSGDSVDRFRAAGGRGPVWSQLTLCWAGDRDAAVELATRQWPNTGIPGQLSQDLRTIAHFEQAAELVTPELIADSIPCGPDPEPIVESAKAAVEAGIDHLYFHQIGDDQEGFLAFWDAELAEPIRALG